MDYEQFRTEVKEHIKEFLPEKFKDSNVDINKIEKNRSSLYGLIVHQPDINISPTVYLDTFYERMKDGVPLGNVMEDIAATIEKHSLDKDFNVKDLMKFENAKDNIFPRVMGIEANENLLAERPHQIVAEDLAVTYAIKLNSSFAGEASIPITNNIMEHFGISKEELHEIAMNNLNEKMEINITSMRDLMKEMMMKRASEMEGIDREATEQALEAFLPDENPMFVVTNKEKCNGAVSILSEKAMDEAAEMIGGDFFVLPSSTHECILVPLSVAEDGRETLEGMVKEVNQQCVKAEDTLSNSVYAYDSNAHELMRADKYEERMALKAMEKEAVLADKGITPTSFKERVSEAKKEVAKENAHKTPEKTKKMEQAL